MKGSTESSNSNEACGTPLTAGATSVIRHVVYIIKENRSFDNMFGAFPNANGASQRDASYWKGHPTRPYAG